MTASLRWGQGTGNWGTDDLYKPVYDEEDYMQVTFSNKKQHSVCLLRNKIDTSVNSRGWTLNNFYYDENHAVLKRASANSGPSFLTSCRCLPQSSSQIWWPTSGRQRERESPAIKILAPEIVSGKRVISRIVTKVKNSQHLPPPQFWVGIFASSKYCNLHQNIRLSITPLTATEIIHRGLQLNLISR